MKLGGPPWSRYSLAMFFLDYASLDELLYCYHAPIEESEQIVMQSSQSEVLRECYDRCQGDGALPDLTRSAAGTTRVA